MHVLDTIICKSGMKIQYNMDKSFQWKYMQTFSNRDVDLFSMEICTNTFQ